MAAREAFNGAPGPVYLEIPRDVLDREVDLTKAVDSAARQVPRLDAFDRRSARHREARRHSRQCGAAGDSVRPAGVDGARPERGDRAAARPRHSRAISTARAAACCRRAIRITSTARARQAFAKADVLVIVGTPFDFRMGYGKRISKDLKLVQIDMDYRTVGKNRDIDLGLVGDPGAILGAVLQAASGRIKSDKRQARQQWLKQLSARGSRRDREAHAAVQIEQRADSSVPGRVGAERVPRRQHDLHRRRRRCGDDLGAGGAAAPARPMDGSGRARLARRRHRLCDRRGARQSLQGSPLLLRRRLVRHDGVRHGDGQPLRRALSSPSSATTRP